jgi:hypothetical protein
MDMRSPEYSQEWDGSGPMPLPEWGVPPGLRGRESYVQKEGHSYSVHKKDGLVDGRVDGPRPSSTTFLERRARSNVLSPMMSVTDLSLTTRIYTKGRDRLVLRWCLRLTRRYLVYRERIQVIASAALSATEASRWGRGGRWYHARHVTEDACVPWGGKGISMAEAPTRYCRPPVVYVSPYHARGRALAPVLAAPHGPVSQI